MSRDTDIVHEFTSVLMAGPWTEEALQHRIAISQPPDSSERWIAPFVRGLLATHPADGLPPTRRIVLRTIQRLYYRQLGLHKPAEPFTVEYFDVPPPALRTVSGVPSSWTVPRIASTDALAHWFSLTPTQLDWLADVHGRERKRERESLRHYRYRWLPKSANKYRLIEDPKPLLKSIQRCLLQDVLNIVEPHDAAHAFRPGRSVASYVSSHVGQDVVLHMDLRNFFPSIDYRRVLALFRWIGYPEEVAKSLAGLCTNRVPMHVLDEHPSSGDIDFRQHLKRLYGGRHLPQGAPTSPALANLVAYRLDCRLSGLAQKHGLNYSRYADDLVFSGGRRFRREMARFRIFVCAIAINEGFDIRHRKTRVMTRGRRQEVAGVVLNQRLNTPRDEYDRLRATLFNCIQHGPARENRTGREYFREHLQGRIAYIGSLNPIRGDKLTRLFKRIEW